MKNTYNNQEFSTFIRFPELYNSPEWLSMDTIDRVQLLLVLEGVKPGTIIGGNHTSFLSLLQKHNLEYSYTSDPGLLKPVFMVGSKKILDEYFRKLLLLPQDIENSDYHIANGTLLGYPQCCTDEYCLPQKNIIKRKMFSPGRFISNFTYESIENGSYPEEFDYCPPSFTPCSIYCEEARKLLSEWMDTMKVVDPLGAADMRNFNRRVNNIDRNLFKSNTKSQVKKILTEK